MMSRMCQKREIELKEERKKKKSVPQRKLLFKIDLICP